MSGNVRCEPDTDLIIAAVRWLVPRCSPEGVAGRLPMGLSPGLTRHPAGLPGPWVVTLNRSPVR